MCDSSKSKLPKKLYLGIQFSAPLNPAGNLPDLCEQTCCALLRRLSNVRYQGGGGCLLSDVCWLHSETEKYLLRIHEQTLSKVASPAVWSDGSQEFGALQATVERQTDSLSPSLL